MTKPYVFLSHSSRDKPVVRRINRRLRQCGIATFLDEAELDPADDLPARFSKAIGASSHIVVAWTEAAAASPWVQKELALARRKLWRKPQIVPLLFIPPGHDPVIRNIKGLDFSDAFGFEAAFAQLARFITGRAPAETHVPPGDLDAALRDLPAAARLLEAHNPADISTFALPEFGQPDWATLDYILWAAVKNADQVRAYLSHPEVFAKVFARTGAGYEALQALAAMGDYNTQIFHELIQRDAISDAALDRVIQLAETTPHPNKGWAWRFARANLLRMSAAQRRRLFALVERWGDTPSPGSPVDLLGALAPAEDMRAEVIAKMASWMNQGLFDGASQEPPRESPYTFHGFIRGLDEAGLGTEAEALMERAYERIRRLFRSGAAPSVLTALRWVADADRLPLSPRPYVQIIARAVQDGVYSVEFESWAHAKAVAPIAGALARGLQPPHAMMRQQTMGEARTLARQELSRLGMEIPGL